MKTVGFYSILLHAVAFTAALEAGHLVVTPALVPEKTKVVELSLGAPPMRAPTVHWAAQRASSNDTQMNAVVEQARLNDVLMKDDPSLNTRIDLPSDSAPAFKSNNSGAVKVRLQASDPTGTTGNIAHATGVSNQGQNNTQDSLPYIVANPAPIYPKEARRHEWTGRVSVRVLISTRGEVEDLQIASSSGHTPLDTAALEALRHWIFHPAMQKGQAIAAWVVVPVSFTLD